MGNQDSGDLISLPPGGGAVRPLGETFQPDPHTGTGNYAVPIELPPGRRGLQPSLSLSYSSGNGAGPFGLGWTLTVPSVRRRTARRIPRYDGTDGYVLAGSEDLVPVPGGAPGAQRYRPRVEALFGRVEHLTAGTDHWQVWTGNGLRSRYGTPRPADAAAGWADPAVVADPDAPGRVLSWLLTETSDSLGNRIAYTYRGDPADPRSPQRYLSTIGYADYPDPDDPTVTRFLAQVRLRYEARPDVTCDRRAGFPVATALRCTAVEVWTDPGEPRLVRTVALRYVQADNGASLLAGIRVTGHDGDATESLPELEFGYSRWEPTAHRYRDLSAPGDAPPPTTLAHPDLDLVDLYGDGLPGLLQLSAAGARFWRNRGNGLLDRPRALAAVPAGVALGAAGVQLADLDGDGRPDLLVSDDRRVGYFPCSRSGGFDPRGFVSYRRAPSFRLTDPETRLIDLDGDGVVDVLRTGAVPQVHLNDRAAGWVPQQVGTGSAVAGLSFADSRLRLADMTGDGLTDIVLVDGGQVRYWPNLGYGRFGPPVVLRGHLDLPGATPAGGPDQRRLLLGDVNGDGCADLVYVGPGWVQVWVNRCGRSLGPGVLVRGTPTVDDTAAVRLTDMTGTGTAGVLWSSDRPRAGRMSFLDLTGGVKPYLLTSVDNHAGTRTEISYETSVQHAARDAAAGRPWLGTLPFPVHVVGAVTTVDSISASRLSSVFTYHHGHWDGAEREFRGFGRVDRYDTQQFARQGDLPAESYSPPALTRTWFHLGPVGPAAGDWQELDLSGEHWAGDPDLLGPGDRSTLPAGLDRRVRRDVARALAGRVLRTEVYGLDGGSRADRPYTVTEHRWDVRAVGDPTTDGWSRNPVLAVAESANRTTTWERGDDPHTTVTFHGGFDAYGRTRRSAGVAVPRGRDPRRPGPGAPPLCTVSTVEYATRDDDTGYRTDLTARVAGYEVFSDGSHPLADLERALATDTLPRRLRSYARHGYDGEPYQGLPAGRLGGHGLLTSTATLALTAGTLGRDLGPTEVPPYLRPPVPAHGLRGEYFRDDSLGVPAFVRPDPAVDFAWHGGPDPALAQPVFSARWTGTLTPTESGTYTVAVEASGPARLWLADQLLVDTWPTGPDTPPAALVGLPGDGPGGPPPEDPGGLPTAGAVPLTAGTAYPVRLEYRAVDWVAGVRLLWSPDTAEPQPVPTTVLAPPPETVDWSPRHPPAFRDAVPDLAGYHYRAGDDGDPAGYYTVTGARYDVHDTPTGRGLTVATRDPLGHETSVTYDAFALLPVAVTDPAGLVRTAEHDYRLCKPRQVVDVNGNRSGVGYTPLGLVAWTAALGRPDAREGDTVEQPGAVFHYGLTAWEESPPQARQPSWVHTVRRTEHRWALVAAADAARAAAGEPPLDDAGIAALFPADEPTRHPERFVATRTYCDGSGRAVQTRSQGDDLVVDDLGLAPEPGAPTGPLTAHPAGADQPAVVVSGWLAYDNKGRVVRAWEPTPGVGWEYAPPTVDGLASSRTFYDPRGEVVRTVHPDGAQDLIVRGVPVDPTDPEVFAPTPWEHYTYDRNDNAGRTHPETSTAWAAHRNTPSSATMDPLCRLRVATTRTAPGVASHTKHEHDVDGRLLAMTDPASRPAARFGYDLLGRGWSSWAQDTGATVTVRDAAGEAVEHRDAKGGLTLHAYDALGRPVRAWAADRAGAPTTLREVTVYGDAGLPAAVAAAGNLLGRPWRGYDEAGLVTCDGYDLAGRLTGSTRRVLAADLLLSAGPDGYLVDWQPADGQTLDQRAAALLDPEGYATAQTHDALGRRTTLVCPSDVEGRRRVLRLRYGRSGALTGLDVDGTPYLRRILYDARGRRIAAWYGNGVLTRYRYSRTTLRLLRQHSQAATGSAAADGAALTWTPTGPVHQDQTYEHDLVGNVLAVRERGPGCGLPGVTPDALDRLFGYDPLYRLTSATGREHVDPPPALWSAAPRGVDPTATRAFTETYDYDPVGNLTGIAHRAGGGGWTRTMSTAPDGNRLVGLAVGQTTVGYRHDACGNLLQEADSRHFAWNAGNQLVAFRVQADGAAVPSRSSQYRYDATGARVLKLTRDQGGGTELTVYVDGVFERLVVTAPAGAVTRHDEVHLADGATRLAVLRVGPPLPADARPPVAYHLVDQLGSGVVVLDERGDPVNREEYTPYGETSFGSYARKRYRYSGRERDEESGLARHGARYLAPWLGRWISADPAGQVDGTALYTYVRGNPLRLVDNSGLASVPTQLGTGAIADGPLADLWTKAVNQVMKSEQGGAKFAQLVQEAYETKGMGSNRAAGTAINVARETYSKVRTVFGQLAEAKGISLKGVQLHHLFGKDGLGGLAHDPWKALDPTGLKPVTGNAGTPGTLHNLLHESEAALQGKAAEMVGKLSKDVGEAARDVGAGARRIGRAPGAAGFARLGTLVGIAGGVGTGVAAVQFAADVRAGRTVDAVGHGSQAVAGGFDLAALASSAGGGTVAGTTLTTSVAAAPALAVGGAVASGFAIGWTVGGVINDRLSADTQHAIGGTVNEIVNEGGWKLLFTHPFGIGM